MIEKIGIDKLATDAQQEAKAETSDRVRQMAAMNTIFARTAIQKINEIVEHLNLLDTLITDHADYHGRLAQETPKDSDGGTPR